MIKQTNDKKWCVYVHTNKTNNKVYVGITSRSLEIRCGKNGAGYKNQPHFWNAIQTYGWDNFTHEILFDNLTREEANIKEREMISFYNSMDRDYGYNLTGGGDGILGYKHTIEELQKISEASLLMWSNLDYRIQQAERLRELWNNDEFRKRQIDGRVGTNNPMYGKQRIVSDETRIKISETLTGIVRSEETRSKMSEAQKIIWSSEEKRKQLSNTLKEYYSDKTKHPMYGKMMPDVTKQKIAESNGISVLQFSFDGVFIAEYISTSEAARINHLYQPNISKCCKTKHGTSGGFIWIYKSDFNPDIEVSVMISNILKRNTPEYKLPQNARTIIQLDKQYNFINEFESIKLAHRSTNISDAHISECCSGKGTRKSAGGFKWMYKEDYEAIITQQNDLWEGRYE